MEAGRYLIRINKPIAYLDERHYTQVASFNPTWGRAGKFYIGRGSAGYILIARSSAEVICKLNNFLGSGIYMTLQPWTQSPEIGDWIQDADLGEMVWDGKEWINV